jgi:sugar phosphate isomerase/epimerase
MYRMILCAALACAGARAGYAGQERLHGDFDGPWGLQLYSMRAQLEKDVPDALDEVRTWGVRFVELAGTYGLAPAQFKAELDAHHLDPVSGHFPYERFRDDPEAVALEAAQLGLIYAGCAWIPHQGTFDEQACRDAIAVFNRAGKVLASHKMKFFYHTHGYEFVPCRGGTLFDKLVQGTDPKDVHFEMDIFWVFHAGKNPVAVMDKYPNRFELMHLKDMRQGTRLDLLTGSSDVRNDVALGAGVLDLRSILREAKDIGVQWYFIEDESPDSERQIPQSIEYLEKVQF